MNVVRGVKLPAPDWPKLWDDLKDADRLKAYTAFWHLRESPALAIALLKKQLQPVPHVDAKHVKKLLADLDAASFAQREKATAELIQLADHLELSVLKAALEARPSLEAQRRLQRILTKTGGMLETRRLLWCVRLLEMIGTLEARELLHSMTRGEPASSVTRQARHALARLEVTRTTRD